MYKVTYYLSGGPYVSYKSFESLSEALTFSNKQAINSVIEIKLYETETNNIQNEPDHIS